MKNRKGILLKKGLILFLTYNKGKNLCEEKRYTIAKINYMIHTLLTTICFLFEGFNGKNTAGRVAVFKLLRGLYNLPAKIFYDLLPNLFCYFLNACRYFINEFQLFI